MKRGSEVTFGHNGDNVVRIEIDYDILNKIYETRNTIGHK